MPLLVLVGGESLLAREVRDVLSTLRHHELRLVASSGGGVFASLHAESDAQLFDELTADSLAGADAILLAGTHASSRKALRLTRELAASTPLIDLTGALEEQPEARLAPSPHPSPILVTAQPAAIALNLALRAIHHASPIRHATATILEPASQLGQRGLDELQQQAAALFSFRPQPDDTFDAQLAFNLLPRYGPEAVVNLEDIELTVERHLVTLLSGSTPMPSLRLVQAPVFHGHSFSIWIEFLQRPDPESLLTALNQPGIDLRTAEHEPPTNVGVAGQSGITLGLIEPDRNHPNALWLWMAADGFRLVADTALQIVRSLVP